MHQVTRSGQNINFESVQTQKCHFLGWWTAHGPFFKQKAQSRAKGFSALMVVLGNRGGKEKVVTLSPCPLLVPARSTGTRACYCRRWSQLAEDETRSHHDGYSVEMAPLWRATGGGLTHSLWLCCYASSKELCLIAFNFRQIMHLHGVEFLILKVHSSIEWKIGLSHPVFFPRGSVCS